MKQPSDIFYGILSAALLILGAFLLFVDEVILPSRNGAAPVELIPPATWVVSGMPIAFGLALLFRLKDAEKYDKVCRVLITIGVVSGFLGFVIVAPLTSH